MSDIEQLRQDVINAARNVRMCCRSLDMEQGYALAMEHMHNKLAALDEAERIYPWQLLRLIKDHLKDGTIDSDHSVAKEVSLALKWREEHPND